ncbi:hypothetical protein [Moorena sp. SIO3H5]|uniref:hypothetical protein n=1 Tax=Moorena sp. SIO3H5 TaxID=2607834 RepID=UPI0013BBAD28|nr:hypothetical protein [Moorena sp. SIO3H5]NEO70829.1 hypothetical protein [Moorena sp. SIO3H5]
MDELGYHMAHGLRETPAGFRVMVLPLSTVYLLIFIKFLLKKSPAVETAGIAHLVN